MDPITGAMIGTGLQIGGTVGGMMASEGDRRAAGDQMDRAAEIMESLKWGGLSDIQYERLKEQGLLTPEMVEAYQQQKSQMEGVKVDPSVRLAQMRALQGLQQRVDLGGLAPEDMAAFRQVQAETDRANQAKQASLLQEYAARGMAGSGNELASRMLAQQAQAQQAAEQSDRVASQASQARLAALGQLGTMGTSIGSQDFSQQAQIAQAQDAINRFNVGNMQDISRLNVGTRNAAQERNLSRKELVADKNVGISNEEQYFNKYTKPIANFEQEIKSANARAGAANMRAGKFRDQAAATMGAWSAVGKGGADIFSGLSGGGKSGGGGSGPTINIYGGDGQTMTGEKKFNPNRPEA